MRNLDARLDGTYLRRLLWRALIFFAAARAILAGMAAGAAEFAGISAPGGAILIAAVAAMSTTDARLMRETVFQANLGAPTWLPAAVGGGVAAVAVLLELLLLAAV
jgi:hypothetical protein